MISIARNPSIAKRQDFDLIVIGGGIHGIALALVASESGLSCLLLEKNDFGWATSYNSLRTIHGGLRYLQKMDLPRFFESVRERRWFLRAFPGLVTPLPCLMPLYGNGMYRPSVFKVALALNDLLSLHRNRGLPPGQRLPGGRVLNPAAVKRIFPAVRRNGLKGGALWHDGGMPASQLVVMAMLGQACRSGAMALNYTEVTDLIQEDGQVRGVLATDRETGRRHRFNAPRVINAAGPWCRVLASRFDRDDPTLFRYSIAWNVLFNRPALSSHSLALKPDLPDARMYFLHGWHGRIMGGTVHDPWPGPDETPMPDGPALQRYLDHLNNAVPGLSLSMEDIAHVYSGLLPVKEQGGNILTVREMIKDHGQDNGPEGLYTVAGIKFTTARKVAKKTLRKIFPSRPFSRAVKLPLQPSATTGLFPWNWLPGDDEDGWQDHLKTIISKQSVVHLDDLILRRTTIGDNPGRALRAAPAIVRLFEWDHSREAEEVERLRHYFRQRQPAAQATTSG